MNSDPNAQALALAVAFQWSGFDGSHHKDWVIDQIVRALTGDKYNEFVEVFCNGEEGPDTYKWDTGIAP
ncbi:MAG: hypothetical protein H9W81_10130 [Enterococcus sp.]|nr:hypothetical protein [Enterococcus sp.]